MIVENRMLNAIGDEGQPILFSDLDPRWAAIAVDIMLEDGTRDGVIMHVPGVSVKELPMPRPDPTFSQT